MREKIDQQEKRIEAVFMLMSSKKELENVYRGLRTKYENIKGGLVNNPTDFELKKYYAELLSFTEMELNYVMNLHDKQTGNRNIFDLSEDKVDEKIENELEALKKIIVYMKQEFPQLGNILEKRLMELESNYRKDFEKALVYDKNTAEEALGINKEISLTLTGSVDRIELKYLLDLQIFEELLIGDSKKIISMSVDINNKYNEVLEMLNKHDDFVVSKLCKQLTVFFEEYKENIMKLDTNGDIDTICSQLAKKIKEYKNRLEEIISLSQRIIAISSNNKHQYKEMLEELNKYSDERINKLKEKLNKLLKEYENQIEQIANNETMYEELIKIEEKYGNILEQFSEDIKPIFAQISMEDYYNEILNILDNTVISKINISEIQSIITKLIENKLLTEEVLGKLYNIIELELITYGVSKLYTSFDEAMQLRMEKIFFNKLKLLNSQGVNVNDCLKKFARGFDISIILDIIKNSASLRTFTTKIIKSFPGEELLERYKKFGDYFQEGLAAVQDQHDNWGFIDKEGNEVIRCEYKDACRFSEGLAAVEYQYALWAFIDKEGKKVIKCQYNKDVRFFQEGLAAVQDLDNKWGFIDREGNEVIKCQYKDVRFFQEGLVAVQDQYGDWGFIDREGNKVIRCRYKDVMDFQEGLAPVKNNVFDNWGFIDKEGNRVIKCQYKDACRFSEGLAAVQDQYGDWGFIDKKGKEVIKCKSKYNYVEHFQEGLAPVRHRNDKWGFIDKKGKEVIKCQYEEVMGFQEGLAPVKNIFDKWGFIDKEGNEVIKCQYKDACRFSEGLAAVQDRYGAWGFIDKEGKKVQHAIGEELNVKTTLNINLRDKQMQLKNLRSKIQYINPLVDETKKGK